MSDKTTGQSDALKMLHTVWGTVQPWAQRNVTFGLVLAVCTEVPRWTFAFKAAHEPIWAGCALAILISYAAAHAWEEYFRLHSWLLLTLNSLSLFFGVYTIAPVLYLMSSAQDHATVQLSDVFSTWFIGSWSIVLACTTFLPLIQVAVVEVRRRDRVQPEVQPKAKKVAQQAVDTVQMPAAIVQPVAPIVQPVIIETVQPDEDEQPDPQKLAVQLRNEGLKNAQIGERLGVHRNTISKWLSDANRVAA
jgi:hypothetical protein